MDIKVADNNYSIETQKSKSSKEQSSSNKTSSNNSSNKSDIGSSVPSNGSSQQGLVSTKEVDQNRYLIQKLDFQVQQDANDITNKVQTLMEKITQIKSEQDCDVDDQIQDNLIQKSEPLDNEYDDSENECGRLNRRPDLNSEIVEKSHSKFRQNRCKCILILLFMLAIGVLAAIYFSRYYQVNHQPSKTIVEEQEKDDDESHISKNWITHRPPMNDEQTEGGVIPEDYPTPKLEEYLEISVDVHDYNCAKQVSNYGQTSTPKRCGQLAAKNECKYFMWSHFTQWQCRCCDTKEHEDKKLGKPNKNWDIYKVDKKQHFVCDEDYLVQPTQCRKIKEDEGEVCPHNCFTDTQRKQSCQCSGKCPCKPPSIWNISKFEKCEEGTTLDDNAVQCVPNHKLLENIFRQEPQEIVKESGNNFKIDPLIINKWKEIGPIPYEALHEIGAFEYNDGFFEDARVEYKENEKFGYFEVIQSGQRQQQHNLIGRIISCNKDAEQDKEQKCQIVEGSFEDDTNLECSNWCRKIVVTKNRQGEAVAKLKYFPQNSMGAKVINQQLQDYFMYNSAKNGDVAPKVEDKATK